MNSFRLIGLPVVLCGLALQAHGQVTPVSSVSDLNSNDQIDWGQLGPNFNTTPSPTGVASEGGLSAIVTDGDFDVDGNQLLRLDQGSGFYGNFAAGDQLLYNIGPDPNIGPVNPLVVDFADPVFGAGAQIQPGYEGAFTAIVSAYDSTNTLLGSFDFSGFSSITDPGDGSAIFVGVSSTTADISSISFSDFADNGIGSGLQDNGTNDVLIDTLYLNTNNVPDAGNTFLLLGLAAVSLHALRIRLARSVR